MNPFQGLETEWKLFVLILFTSVFIVSGVVFVSQYFTVSNQVQPSFDSAQDEPPPPPQPPQEPLPTKLEESPVTEAFEDWNTYRSEEFSFELKYPDGYFTSESGGHSPLAHPENFGRVSVMPEVPDIAKLMYVDIDLVDPESFSNLTDYIAKTYEDRISLNHELSVDNIEIEVYKSKDSDFFYSFLENSNYIFNLSSPSVDLLTQILFTFRFIELIDTSDWQTYRNDEFGFEIRHPSDWTVQSREGSDVVVTLNSPTNEAIRESIVKGDTYGEGYIESILIYYYEDILSEPENGANANTLEEFTQKNSLVSDARKITFAGYPSFEMTRGGFDLYHTIMIDKGGEIYEILFGSTSEKAALTEIEQGVLSTFRFVE